MAQCVEYDETPNGIITRCERVAVANDGRCGPCSDAITGQLEWVASLDTTAAPPAEGEGEGDES